mmetsp:Transcript_16352/g.27014  ORF Transcript_16352/g.27014 Transcript_16352/m.27014 type:complete len:196 (+) Transcript_16352:86-673(+)
MLSSLEDQTGKHDTSSTAEFSQPESVICAICRSEPSGSAIKLPCDHQFCFDCIREWSNTKNSCPLCYVKFSQLVTPDGIVETVIDSDSSSRRQDGNESLDCLDWQFFLQEIRNLQYTAEQVQRELASSRSCLRNVTSEKSWIQLQEVIVRLGSMHQLFEDLGTFKCFNDGAPIGARLSSIPFRCWEWKGGHSEEG